VPTSRFIIQNAPPPSELLAPRWPTRRSTDRCVQKRLYICFPQAVFRARDRTSAIGTRPRRLGCPQHGGSQSWRRMETPSFYQSKLDGRYRRGEPRKRGTEWGIPDCSFPIIKPLVVAVLVIRSAVRTTSERSAYQSETDSPRLNRSVLVDVAGAHRPGTTGGFMIRPGTPFDAAGYQRRNCHHTRSSLRAPTGPPTAWDRGTTGPRWPAVARSVQYLTLL
jgi:hypothetical protein